MNNRRLCVALAASAGALAFAASAHASITFYSFGSGAATEQLISDFSNDTAGSAPSYAPTGYAWSGSAVVQDTTSGLGAEPALAGGAYGAGNYLDIEGGKSETLTVPGSAGFKAIGMYVGSLDTFNKLTFTLADGSHVTYTGNDMGLASGAANGNQTAANTNGVFQFHFDQSVTGVQFQSTTNSFEIGSVTGGVPEPATWALMILGLGMIGAAARRRNQGLAAAVA